MQTSQTWGQLFSDTFPYEESKYSLPNTKDYFPSLCSYETFLII